MPIRIRLARCCQRIRWRSTAPGITRPAPSPIATPSGLSRRPAAPSHWLPAGGQPRFLGVALYRAGRYAEAISFLDRGLAALPIGEGNTFTKFFLAMAHQKAGACIPGPSLF